MSTSIKHAIEAYSYEILAHSKNTQKWYLHKLGIFAEWCEGQNITLENVHLSKHDAYLEIYGKGNKWREVPFGNQACVALHKYIHRYRPKVTHLQVFLNRASDPLTLSGLIQIFKRLGEWGHVKGVRCSCHTARHTYAVTYLKNGGDVYKLSKHTHMFALMICLTMLSFKRS